MTNDGMRTALESESAPSRTRTLNLLIKSQRVGAEMPDRNAHSENRAAAGAAVDSDNAPVDAELQAIIEA